jgi:DNA-binding transcriptional ArsR family regulator
VTTRTKRRKSVDEALVGVVSHPLRMQALSVLTERHASPKELAAELGDPLANVSYHVRELEDAGLIELVEEKTRRGAVEHFYRAITRPLFDDAEWGRLSAEKRARISVWIVQLLFADLSRALGAGSFVARPNNHLSRVPLTVDEEGWEELVEIQARALRDVLEVEAASAKRLTAADREEGIPAIAAMTFFEMPPRRSPGVA